MRKLIMICLFMVTGYALNAQANEREAKAAYLLAEESYGKGDYKSTLEFLGQVREALGSTNCKILYLQIMATRELYAKDTSNNSKLLSLILEFEKSPDYANFNEEKSVEISKLKLLAKGEQKAAREEQDRQLNKLAELKIAREKRIDSMEKARTPVHKEAFTNEVNQQGKFGITLDELDKAHPKWRVNKWIKEKLSPTVDLYHSPVFSFETASFPFPTTHNGGSKHDYDVSGVYVKDGKVTGYQWRRYEFDAVFDGAMSSYNIYLGLTNSYVQIYSTRFLLDPIIVPFTVAGVTANRYLWTEGKYGYMIEEMHYPKGGGGIAKSIITVFYNPTEKETSSYHPAEK